MSANGLPLLAGLVRDYTAWEPPTLPPPIGQLPDPYEQPNLIVLADNTSSAQAEAWFAYAAITTGLLPPLELDQFSYLPIVVSGP